MEADTVAVPSAVPLSVPVPLLCASTGGLPHAASPATISTAVQAAVGLPILETMGRV